MWLDVPPLDSPCWNIGRPSSHGWDIACAYTATSAELSKVPTQDAIPPHDGYRCACLPVHGTRRMAPGADRAESARGADVDRLTASGLAGAARGQPASLAD